jgi:parallel beta-helix repeat protein
VLALENRRLLSTFHVTSTADDGSVGTLRWAVQQADAATSPSTIDFELGNAPATITLSQGQLELSNTAEPTTINGPGAGLLSINGNRAGSVFRIDRMVSASLTGLTLTGGSSSNHGGGVDNSGSLMLSDCTISGNTSQHGGGLFNEGTATITNCTISGNSVVFEGAGIYNDSTLTLGASTIRGNSSHETGGGLQNKGTATLTDCTIGGNSALDNSGGIYNARTLNLTGCTIGGNTSGGFGGGLSNYSAATLTDSTISFNIAHGGGGGVSNSGNGPGNQTTLTLTACTISDNSAAMGGGIYNHKGLVNPAVATLTDTIVALNFATGPAPGDIGGPEAANVTGSFNLIGNGGSGRIQGGVQGNIVLANLDGLGLANPDDYGGPTETLALMPGSAAIGMGTPVAGLATDQRGFALDAPRPDIGAFQTGTAPLVVAATTDNGTPPGVLDLRGAVNLADVRGGAQTITFDPTVFATRTTITLTAGQLELSNTTGTVTIDGPGANLLSINGNQIDRVFKIDRMVTASLSGLTITGASSISFGGGVYNAGTATLTGCVISGNTSGYGGGLFNQGTITLDHCTITGNSASVEGGGLWFQGAATLTDCTISGNTSGDIGGGLNNRSATLTMTGCIITGNLAQDFGGGVYNQATATITGCTISGNTARMNGGGLVSGIVASSTLTACTISGNTAQGGGGLENYSRTMLTACTITGNAASMDGGGVSNAGMVTLTACTISGNVASGSGGGLDNHDFIYHRGVATLTDTIVAGNTAPGGASSDIEGVEAGSVTGSFNLIGPGGSGGIRGGVQGNIVLNSLDGLGLAPLGDYGGPTQTIALLPGSPALGAGTPVAGVTTDQRGEPLDATVDIGAFQSLGFTITPTPGTTPQSTPTGEAFPNPLAVTVVARNPVEPVTGGIVSFTVTPDSASGAGAVLSALTAVIGADHQARVTATANDLTGTYVVTATSAGGLSSPRIMLTNLPNDEVVLNFSGLIDRSIVFGTDSVTLTGTLSNGQQAPPPGETVAIALGGVTQQAVIGPDGTFTATFNAAGLTVAGSPYRITYHYTSDGTFASAQTTSMLTVARAMPTLSAANAGGTFNGAAFAATAGVAGVSGTASPSLEGVASSLAYYSGTFTSAAQLAGLVPLAGAPSQAGSYTVVASFAGSSDYAASLSAPVNFAIGRATATIALEASVGSAVFGQPITFVATAVAAGTPSGSVTFFDGSSSLGAVALDGSGRASLTVTNLSTGSHSITASYGGDPDHVGGVSGSAKESIARASTRVMLVRHPVFRRQKVASVGLTVQIVPLSPGAGAPSGTVKFLLKKRALGSVVLSGGSATLTTRTVGLSRRPITIVYGGDADFEPIVATTMAAPG